MLTFYYNPLSPNARRVWLTLLEKDLPFESVILKLDGDQTDPNFLEISPFHHIPVLVDGDFRLIESLAILDYLEAKYPTPALMPTDPNDVATVRMVQLLIANELFPEMVALIYEPKDSPQFEQAHQKTEIVLRVLTDLLGDRPYFGSHQLTLGDIVAGTAIPLLPHLGVSLEQHPPLQAWLERLKQRPAWQTTQLSEENIELFKRRITVLVKLRRRQWSQPRTNQSAQRKQSRV